MALRENVRDAIAQLAHLGAGGDGPWEQRPQILQAMRARGGNPSRVDAWLNQTYSVQLFRHPSHPGIDHLCIRRHDEGVDIAWSDLQKIKDRLLDDGQFRWAIEVFPPRLDVVDNHNLRHLWVMPADWQPPIQFSDEVHV